MEENMKTKNSMIVIALICGLGVGLAISSFRTSAAETSVADKQRIAELENELNSLKHENDNCKAEKATTNRRLLIFDDLDFKYYSGQVWDKLSLSHTDDIKVIYPDGSETNKLAPDHIEALKPQFVFAPDTKIIAHPIRFGSGDWTAVMGTMEGTFSKPMDIGGGKTVPPTGKKFKLNMVTLGHWKGDKMFEEYLFWDNYAFLKQIGLAN